MNKPNKLTEENQHKDKIDINQSLNKKPDEISGLNVEDKFKIYDPVSGKILVQGRG